MFEDDKTNWTRFHFRYEATENTLHICVSASACCLLLLPFISMLARAPAATCWALSEEDACGAVTAARPATRARSSEESQHQNVWNASSKDEE